MFGKGNAASIMAGEGSNSVISIDMCRCIEQVEPNKRRLLHDKLPDVIKGIYIKWPALQKYESDIMGNQAFRLEECLCNIAIKDCEVFGGVDEICIKFTDREVHMLVFKNSDLLEVYKAAISGGKGVEIQSRNEGNIVIMKENLSFDEMTSDSYRRTYYICVECGLNIKRGETIPSKMRVYTPVTLNDNKLMTPIVVRDNGVIETTGNVIVEAVVPILANGVKEVVIKGTGCLSLVSTGEMQPCIGTMTSTGMSYGRWSPSGERPPERIVVDGVTVVCKSLVENFTLGRYGTDEVPEIVLKNNGKIICPEVEGERIVTRQAKAPEGSTKISTKMEYGILRPGMLTADLINPEVKKYMEELPEHMCRFVSVKTQPENIKEAIRLYKMNNKLDLSLVLDGTKTLAHASTVTLLNNLELYSSREFTLESNKISYLADHFTDRQRIAIEDENIVVENIVACIIIAVHDTLGNSISDYDYEILYEMIPAYFFNGWVRGDKAASVIAYINENTNIRKLVGKIRKYIRIDDIIKELNL